MRRRSELLIVLNPRKIPECVDSIKALDIDKLWVKYMSEATIRDRWPEIMNMAADYKRLYMFSDDAIGYQYHIESVRRLLDEGHPVATGYSNLAAYEFKVNLTKSPLGPFPHPDSYELYYIREVMEYPELVVPTWLINYSFTGMSFSMWERFPFDIWSFGAQSDFHLSKRLEEAGVPMVAARDCFVWHCKDIWNYLDTDERKQLYVNIEPPELVLERASKPTVVAA